MKIKLLKFVNPQKLYTSKICMYTVSMYTTHLSGDQLLTIHKLPILYKLCFHFLHPQFCRIALLEFLELLILFALAVSYVG